MVLGMSSKGPAVIVRKSAAVSVYFASTIHHTHLDASMAILTIREMGERVLEWLSRDLSQHITRFGPLVGTKTLDL